MTDPDSEPLSGRKNQRARRRAGHRAIRRSSAVVDFFVGVRETILNSELTLPILGLILLGLLYIVAPDAAAWISEFSLPLSVGATVIVFIIVAVFIRRSRKRG